VPISGDGGCHLDRDHREQPRCAQNLVGDINWWTLILREERIVHMDFIDRGPSESSDGPRERSQPWVGPPDGWKGGSLPWELVVVSSLKGFAVMRNFEALPEGLKFEVSLMAPDDVHHDPRGKSEAVRPFGGPKIIAVYSDGRRSRTLWREHKDVPPTSETPILWLSGGSHGSTRGAEIGDYLFWLWPLPPPGPLTFVADWERKGVEEVDLVVDATALVHAARAAVKLREPEG